jgi:3-hydroxyisobutyrate dehydrogenase-like beta-hydroxyacid dehydrogenase
MRVAFIGIGTMGSRMAANVQRAGHDLVIHDAAPDAGSALLERGARWADSPREAAREAEVILSSLPGPREVEAVALGGDGIIHGAPEGSIYADLSTSSPTLIRRIHADFAQRGIHVLDTPVSGGPYGAQDGTLQIMVGGDEAVFERAKPALEAIGDKITYCGEIGCGAVAKLVNNMIAMIAGQGMAEGFTLGVKAGVRPEKLLEVISGSAYGRHMSLSHSIPEVVFTGNFDDTRFALALARKDLGLATALGREIDVPMPLANVSEQAYIEAMIRGWGSKDSSSTFMLQEERAGVEVRADPSSGS